MNFDFILLRKGNLLLIAILVFLFIKVNAGGRNTNIVLTKDTILLNDRHKKHSNNIVIKDGHKDDHHCNCHYPMHHYEHHPHHEWDHWHKRSDLAVEPTNWWDMQMAASHHQTHFHRALPPSSFFNENPQFINGEGNEALNQLIKQRYLNQVNQVKPNFEKFQFPVFVKNEH